MKKVAPSGIALIAVLLCVNPLFAETHAMENAMPENAMSASGTFDVRLEPQNDQDAPAGRLLIFKEYTGGMAGTGRGQMISKRTDGGESVYSAIEEFDGEVDGRAGAFTLFHNGRMSGSGQSLRVTIVDGSGSGELRGIQGELSIEQSDGVHKYVLEYSL